ncbi:sigma-70 family RNA polymerase sigma factor [Neorhizobium vignae]|jgi:RNA polymerase sigma-70 factor (ECF subfamily)|uniref:sigma-70 family RNA polymerase sigma factor n=1 Tax=Neorhizobium vignae TaxID=690585 RepID=UPI00068F5A1F|nr:sigma-70 family RNA polymerase sigma factor [Neorhizobium vignae]
MSKILPTDVRHDVVHHIPTLRRFAFRFCRNSTEIDDLVQETLVKAIAASDTFEPGTRLKSWLFTIMRNVYCTSYNKQRRVGSRS